MLVVYLIFGALLVWDFDKAGEGVRIIIPAFLLLGVLVLPAALNSRIIRVGSNGVQVTNGPFPRGRKVDVAREDIRYCNVRVQYTSFESESGGSAKVDNYLVDKETRRRQIDIAYPYLKQEEAEAVAKRMAEALNQDGLLRPIGLARASEAPEADEGWRMKVLAWGGLFIVAIIAGAFGESY